MKEFKVITKDIESHLIDDSIKSVIELINSNFPFTLIGKSKVQKKINQLDEFFWVKDAERNLILLNEKYAAFLGGKSGQIEGTNESELIPKYLENIIKSADNYILESLNPLMVDGVVLNLFNENEERKIIQFPILDIDEKVVAIIGFTKKPDTEKITKSENDELENYPVLIVNSNLQIKEATKSFKEQFSFINYTPKQNLKDIFDKDSIEIIKAFTLREFEKLKTFKHVGIRNNSKKVDIRAVKVLNGSNLTGLNLFFEQSASDEDYIKMYNEVLQSFPEPMFIYDIENLKFIDVNEAALNLYGYDRDLFLSMDLTDLYAPEDIQTLIDSANNQSVEGGFSGPWRQKCKDGKSIIVKISKTDIEYKGKKAHFNIVRDITSKIELQRNLNLYKAAFNNSSSAIILVDRHGFIKSINDVVSEQLGYSKAELEQNSISSILTDEFRSKINDEIIHSSFPDETNFQINLKDSMGNEVEYMLFSTPILDYSEQIDGFSLMFNKIGEYSGDFRVTENSGMNDIDPTFLSSLFHELLTPLNVIIGFVQELSESIEKPSDEQREAIHIIKENQKVLMNTMDTAVEYSHLEQNMIELKPVEVSFVDVLDQVEDYNKKIAESNDVKISHGKISSSLKFVSDKQKFVTFISQMVHFALIMTKESNIFISAKSFGDDEFGVSIRDQKSGIDKDFFISLKSVFTEDENLIRKNFGLSRFTVRLVKRLLSVLNARIAENKSSKDGFTIIFPNKLHVDQNIIDQIEEVDELLPPIDDSALVDDSVKAVEPISDDLLVEEVTGKKEIDLTKYSCLYVEDQVDSQILFKVQMKDLKSVDVANSFEKALPILKSKSFDFIVMDINLQGEYNGLDALRILQKLPAYANVPVIAVTAYVVPGAAEKFTQAGFSQFITKPLVREKIISALENIFG